MILTLSLIQVVFRVEPDKFEFQGKLTTPGNSVLTRHSFSNSDESPSPLKSGGRGSVMFSARYGFRRSHRCLGNLQYEGTMIGLKKKKKEEKIQDPHRALSLSSLGGSLKTFLFWGSGRTYSKLYASLLQHGKGIFTPSYITGYKLLGFALQSEFSAVCAAAAWDLWNIWVFTAGPGHY